MSNKTSGTRASSCAYTFSDGRQCRSLPHHNSKYCLHHDRKLRRLREEESTAAFVAEPLESTFISESSLNSALSRLFSAIIDQRVSHKTAIQLINLSRILYKTIPRANQEFLMAFKNNQAYERLIREVYGYKESSTSESKNSTNNENSKKNESTVAEFPKTGLEFAKQCGIKVE
jgi:hypothetical protein